MASHGGCCWISATPWSAKADVLLKLEAKLHGRFKQVAATTLHGHKGHNSFRLAGRWHGQLVPARVVRLLVHIDRDGTWALVKTHRVTVKSPYTTKILNRH